MLAYHWPGNVRELENVMRRFLVYQDADMLARELREEALSLKLPGEPKMAPADLSSLHSREPTRLKYRSPGSGLSRGGI